MREGTFWEPYFWMDEMMSKQWLLSYGEFGEVEDFREGTLEPRSALLY